MLAKIKVVILNKHGIPIWVKYKSNLSEALDYYEEYKDKAFCVHQTIQLIAYDNTTSLILQQYMREGV